MLALNAANGKTLWSFAAGSSVNAGATIVNDVVYWGSGYAHLGIPGYTGNNKFYAFSKQGQVDPQLIAAPKIRGGDATDSFHSIGAASSARSSRAHVQSNAFRKRRA